MRMLLKSPVLILPCHWGLASLHSPGITKKHLLLSIGARVKDTQVRLPLAFKNQVHRFFSSYTRPTASLALCRSVPPPPHTHTHSRSSFSSTIPALQWLGCEIFCLKWWCWSGSSVAVFGSFVSGLSGRQSFFYSPVGEDLYTAMGLRPDTSLSFHSLSVSTITHGHGRWNSIFGGINHVQPWWDVGTDDRNWKSLLGLCLQVGTE